MFAKKNPQLRIFFIKFTSLTGEEDDPHEGEPHLP
jgi:hypothetical protein